MARWRLRAPATFPLFWHTIMTYPVGSYPINAFGRDWEAAKEAQEEWRLFQYCLRNHSNHPTCALLENGLSRRTRLAWDNSMEQWVVWLDVRESKQARWKNRLIFVEPH